MTNKTKLQKNLFILALPIFLEMFLNSLVGAVDVIMLNNYNIDQVTSVGNANTVMNFLIVLLNVISVGVSVVVSQYLGAKKEEEAKKTLSSGVLFNVLVGTGIFLLLQFFGIYLFQLINTPADALAKAVSYMKIVTIGIPFMAVTSVLSANLRSHGKPLYVMVAAIVANLMNVFLNYCFIYGNFGLPELGSDGAAIGTLASMIFNFICAVIFSKIILKAKIFSFKLHKESLSRVFRIGGPSALENICYNVAVFATIAAVNLINKNAVAARTNIMLVLAFVYIFASAFGSANQIIVGYNVGERDLAAARKATYKAFYVSAPIILLVIILLNIFGKNLFSFMIRDNTDVVNMAVSVLPLLFALELGRCVNIVFISALKATGDVFFPLGAAIFSMFFIGVAGSWIFGIWFKMGLFGIFIAYALDEVVRAGMMLYRWKSNRWQRYALQKAPNLEVEV